jgi:20S proteasome subunit beta 4
LAGALRKGPYQTNLILAGYDAPKVSGAAAEEKEGAGDNGSISLYQMDHMASLCKSNFAAHGYAANFILSVFDRDWRQGLDMAGALEVVRKCIHELKTRFLISQPVFILKVVDASGTRTITM